MLSSMVIMLMFSKIHRNLEKILPPNLLFSLPAILSLILGVYISFPISVTLFNGSDLQFPWDYKRFLGLILIFILAIGLLPASNERIKTYRDELDRISDENKKFKEDWKLDKQYYLDSLQKKSIKIMRDLNLNDTDCRITIYQHDDSRSIFIPILRHSENLVLKSPGRKYYPDDKGLISTAWSNGEAHQQINSVSDDEWVQQNVRRNKIDIETAKSISMKSKGIIGLRLTVNKTDHVGIIIIESLKQRRATSEKLETLKGKKEVQEISTLLKVTNNRIFNPNI